MISFIVHLAVVACAHAQVQTVAYAGEDAKTELAGKEPFHTFTIPAGECEAYFPLEQIGCFYGYSHQYLYLDTIKVEVEDVSKVFIEVYEPIDKFFVMRHPDNCDMPAMVKVTRTCMLGAVGPSEVKRPAYRQKGHGSLLGSFHTY